MSPEQRARLRDLVASIATTATLTTDDALNAAYDADILSRRDEEAARDSHRRAIQAAVSSLTREDADGHQLRLLLADPTQRGTWLPRDQFTATGYLRDRKAETAIKTALGTLRQLEPGDGDGWLPAVLALEDALRRLRIRRAA